MSAEVRIGDAEREQAQTTLGDHYAAGRLDHDEYSERLDRIWAARTRAELDPVFQDLPGTAGPVARPFHPYSTPASRRPATAVRTRTRTSRPPVPLVILLVVLATFAVATHLPVIAVGLAVWFLFFRGGSCRSPHRQR